MNHQALFTLKAFQAAFHDESYCPEYPTVNHGAEVSLVSSGTKLVTEYVHPIASPISTDCIKLPAEERSFFNIAYVTSSLARVEGFIFWNKSVERIEAHADIGLLTSAPVASYSESCLYPTVAETVHVVPVKFAERIALVFATKERIVVPPGIPVHVIVAPFTHPVVSATVILGDPLVAQIF